MFNLICFIFSMLSILFCIEHTFIFYLNANILLIVYFWIGYFIAFFLFFLNSLFPNSQHSFFLGHYFNLLDPAKQLNPVINIVCYQTDATKKLIHTTAIKSLLFLVLFLIYCYGWIPRKLSFFFNTVETTLIFFVDTLFCVYYLTLQRLTFQIFLFPECIHIRNFKVLHSCKNLS